MKIDKIIFDGEDELIMIYIYEDGSKEFKTYPPLEEADKKLVEKFGGQYEISKATFRYNMELDKFQTRLNTFMNNQKIQSDNFVIDAIITNSLTKEELMKLKLSIFDHEFVKKSKNRDLLTKIRTSEDPVDLIMYFGMLRKEANVEG